MYVKAIADLNKAISILTSTHQNAGYLYARRARYKSDSKTYSEYSILKDYNISIGFDATIQKGYAYQKRSWYYSSINKFSEAINDLDTALMIDPKNSLYLTSRCNLKIVILLLFWVI